MIADPRQAARDYRWLQLHRSGRQIAAIAAESGLSERGVQVAIARAVGKPARSDAAQPPGPRPPRLVPWFPIGPFTPQSECPHRGPVREGSVLCCMVCHRSGMEGHPGLQRSAATDPRPEKRPAAAGKRKGTRRERRKAAGAAGGDV